MVLIHIRYDILSGLIWVHPNCLQSLSKITAMSKERGKETIFEHFSELHMISSQRFQKKSGLIFLKTTTFVFLDQPKEMLWELNRTVSVRWLFLAS